MKNLGWVVTREEAKTAAGARVQARLEAKKGKGEKGGVAACCLSLTNTSMEYGLEVFECNAESRTKTCNRRIFQNYSIRSKL